MHLIMSSLSDISRYPDVMGDLRFCEWLSDLRFAAGLTQAELGEVVSVGQTSVAQWEDGTTYPSRKYWVSLAAALGVDVEAFRRRIERERPRRVVEGVKRRRRASEVPYLGRVPADRKRLAMIEGLTDVRDVPEEWVRSARYELCVPDSCAPPV